MDIVKFLKCTKEEFEDIYVRLKETGIFNEGYIKVIEMAMTHGNEMQLPKEYAKILEEMGFVQKIHEKNISNAVTRGNEQELKRNESKDEYIPKNNIEHEDDIENEKTEIEASSEVENVDEESDSSNASSDIEKEESIDDEKKEKQETKFMPKSLEEIQNMPEEEKAKRYYLTPERIVESMKRINNGKVWKDIQRVQDASFSLEQAIISAYNTGFYESDLSNPKFLDQRIKEFLPEDNQAVNFEELHKAAVLGTYVGYHVEKNQGDVNEIGLNGEDNSAIKLVKFPLIIDEMPKELLETIGKKLTNSISRSIDDLLKSNDGEKALLILTPIDDKLKEFADDYSESLQNSEEKEMVKAYIRVIKADLPEHMRNDFNELSVSMDLRSVDWNDKDSRENIIYMIKNLQGEGKNIDISKLISEINLNFEVNSAADLQNVDSLCAELSELADRDIDVNIAFALSSKNAVNIGLNSELNRIVGKYENINRDTSTELVNNGLNLAIDTAIKNTITEPLTIAIGDEDIIEQAAFASLEEREGGTCESILLNIAMGAIAEDMEREFEDEDQEFNPLFPERSES
ncbi:MAG: hypothetical protein J6C46_04630 [Clostridia bacterium]|nr:hypothetical protein [Clostridia bacterium]